MFIHKYVLKSQALILHISIQKNYASNAFNLTKRVGLQIFYTVHLKTVQNCKLSTYSSCAGICQTAVRGVLAVLLVV